MKNKDLSAGWQPNDTMRTLGSKMLPMTAHPQFSHPNLHAKKSFPQGTTPPSKAKLVNGGVNKKVQKHMGTAARIKALGF